MRLRLVILSRLKCDVMTELNEEEWLVRRVEKRSRRVEQRREVGEQSREERQESRVEKRGRRDEKRREVREKREGKDLGTAEVRFLLFGLQGDHFCCHTLLPALLRWLPPAWVRVIAIQIEKKQGTIRKR